MNNRIDRIVGIDGAAQQEKESAARYVSERTDSLAREIASLQKAKEEETNALLASHRAEKEQQFEEDCRAVEEDADRRIAALHERYESRRGEWIERIYGEIVRKD